MPLYKNLYLRAALIALPILAIAGARIASTLWQTRDNAIHDANVNNSRVAAVLAEQASQSVKAIDAVIEGLESRFAAERIADDDSLWREMGTRSAHESLARRLTYLPKAEVISIEDRDGKFVVNTRVWPAPDVSMAGHPTFDYLKTHSDRSLVVSLSTPNVVTGRHLIYFSRRLENDRGEFLGTIDIGVRTEYFLTLYDGLASNPGAIVSLVRTDGGVVADYPAKPSQIEKIEEGSDWYKLNDRNAATFRSRGIHSGIPRLVAFNKIGGYPLAVLVGLPEADVLAVWRGRATAWGLQALAILVAFTALTCTLLIQMWKATEAREQLRAKSGELESDNNLFGAVMSNLRQGVAKFDRDDRLLFCNESYARMYGLSRDEIPVGVHIARIWELRIARGVFLMHVPDDYLQRNCQRLRSSGPMVRTSIDHLSDGRYILISHQPLPNGAFITTHEDITQRQTELVAEREKLDALVRERTAQFERKNEELQVALSKQQAVNEQQRSFVAMASHEFRTPLAIIDSAAQKLFRRASQLRPADIIERADTIRRAVQRMTGLMESVLAMAKFEHGEIKASMQESDLYQVVFDACFRQMEVSDRHRIQFDLDALPRKATFDPKLIDQVLTNLLANAIKFSPNDGRIAVRTSLDDGVARIEVEDCGVGIDADDLPKLFTRYFRAKTSTGIAGTGIGLNVVKTIVEMHDGKIEVVSVKGQGTVFTVALPIDGADLRSGGPSRPLPAAA